VTLPPPLQTGIDELVRGISPRELERSSRMLSAAYRAGGATASRAARTTSDVAAYVTTRAPATYAAAAEVLGQIRLLRPEWRPTSVLDLGAGPGIATWAAFGAWPEISAATLVEAEPEMASAGQALARHGPDGILRAAWMVAEIDSTPARADLVVISYVLGELSETARAAAVLDAWDNTIDTLVIVEPGTNSGYRRTLLARDVVTAGGGSTLAPCPHDRPCPLPTDDWCHFAVRLPRTRAHRLAKDAERGYEDEKFSYAVMSRASNEHARPRVIRRPDRRPGHVVLELCTDAGLERRTVSRKEGTPYRDARKLDWGDAV
jgi:ribosomal protein RSM22 (predicted rRNA methylase)